MCDDPYRWSLIGSLRLASLDDRGSRMLARVLLRHELTRDGAPGAGVGLPPGASAGGPFPCHSFTSFAYSNDQVSRTTQTDVRDRAKEKITSTYSGRCDDTPQHVVTFYRDSGRSGRAGVIASSFLPLRAGLPSSCGSVQPCVSGLIIRQRQRETAHVWQ